MKNFEALGLTQPLLDGLAEMGFESPTEIQQQAIPILLKHDGDFIGLAQTGTGKTAAFGIPLLELMDTSSKDTQALILAPTRELAQQICRQIEAMSQKMGKLNVVPVFGGASIMGQIKDIRRGAQVIVATPGRLMDLMKRREVKLDALRFLILDEADEMLNMGFREDIDFILSKTDVGRNIWLFSATMAREIKKIVDTYMKNPEEVRINREDIVNTNISHQYVQLKARDKTEALRRMLDFDQDMFGVVFCRTKRDTQNVADELNNNGYSTEALHGDMSQAQRDAAMKRFRNKNLKLLIATDVAARGIDVDDITHVIHFALPDDPEFYAHRSGRTARAGKKGESIALITKGDMRKLKFMEKKLSISFDRGEIPALEAITQKRISRWTENLKGQEINPKISDELFEEVKASLEDVSKDELIGKFLTKEYNSIYKRNSITDLNDRSKGREDSGEYRERKPRSRGREEGMKTYFINLGRKDDMNKGALLGFVCDVTGIDGKDIGRIVLDGAHSFMDVKEEVAPQMEKINSAERNGRELRANVHDGVVKESRDSRGGRDGGRGRSGGGYKGKRDGNSGGGYKGRRDSGPRSGGFKGRRRDDDSSSSGGGFKGRSSRSNDDSGSGSSFKDRASRPKREDSGSSNKSSGKKGSRSKFFGSKWD
ncbi:ATP-dependent RNA helicase DeaD [Nonlabens dokdonensis]|uniref:ATP-dependent RNA helicase n=2 Tax=Nonlabens dokdonensis TaxID=328515 RepID=L7WC70_NONDD|nr:DEAD/DEAH box helicase [Nonlabens dokdonensis]AGC77694.1 ATP-dependent RNA helicase [Nonlabens dokdonensis DSW-6]PZX39769.1 ATP-dependent RNA helicase DeaD [Nonlabens dokdonensis]